MMTIFEDVIDMSAKVVPTRSMPEGSTKRKSGVETVRVSKGLQTFFLVLVLLLLDATSTTTSRLSYIRDITGERSEMTSFCTLQDRLDTIDRAYRTVGRS